MIKFLIILVFNLVFGRLISQTIDDKFICGAWYDSTKISTGGSGFIFATDSCCNLIINGEMTGCIIESKKVKALYQINFNTNPKQLDIKFIDLKPILS